jgi:secreted PhoX family phosphatase
MIRREFIKTAGAVTLGFAGVHQFLTYWQGGDALAATSRYGSLVRDPEGLLSLPKGFSYQIISKKDEEMDDGLLVPALHDGMAAFQGGGNRTIVIRNHEVNIGSKGGPFGDDFSRFDKVDATKVYDHNTNMPCGGGTTTLVYDTQKQKLERHYMSLSGTVRNCAGGPTPWNSWISCEESVVRIGGSVERDHGYPFEVPAREEMGLVTPIPLKAMGRFNHEAIAVDPKSGVIYLTEDRGDGLLYRFIPNTPGQLVDGGRLQALMIHEQKRVDTRNWDEKITTIPMGHPLHVDWIDLENVESPDDDLRFQGFGKGAAVFARGEGIWYGDGVVYFACTNGGRAKKGQIWKYTPGPYEGQANEMDQPGGLELFCEPNDGNLIENADNLTVTPWGDVMVCEDGKKDDRIVGITPQGKVYTFAHNIKNSSELAGVVFSPDGTTMFANIQSLGYTLAITGPWQG